MRDVLCSSFCQGAEGKFQRKMRNTGGAVMNHMIKGILFVVLMLYVLSPIDFCAGPVDDIIMMLLYAVGNRFIPSGDK